MYMRYIFGAIAVLGALPVVAFAQFGNFSDGIIKPGAAAMLPAAPLTAVIAAAMQWLLSIVGFFAIIAFAVAGVLYLTSAGDEGQAETAKKTAKYALFGIIVALGGMIVLQAVSILLKGESNF